MSPMFSATYTDAQRRRAARRAVARSPRPWRPTWPPTARSRCPAARWLQAPVRDSDLARWKPACRSSRGRRDGRHLPPCAPEILPLLIATAALGLPATASAAFEHVVAPGESLTSVAAADGLSVDQLAAANGLSPDTQLTAGATLQIPPQTGDVGGREQLRGLQTAAPAQSSSSAASSRRRLRRAARRHAVGDRRPLRRRASMPWPPPTASTRPAPARRRHAERRAAAPVRAPRSSAAAACVEQLELAAPPAPQPTAETVSPSDVGIDRRRRTASRRRWPRRSAIRRAASTTTWSRAPARPA